MLHDIVRERRGGHRCGEEANLNDPECLDASIPLTSEAEIAQSGRIPWATTHSVTEFEVLSRIVGEGQIGGINVMEGQRSQ